MRKVVAAFAAVVVGCAGEQKAPSHNSVQSARVATPPPIVQEIASPAGSGAAEPFLATARDGMLLSWLEPVAGTKRVALRVAKYGAGQWSPPKTIVDRDDLFVNWADFPSVVEDANGTLFAHWLQKSGKGTYSYDVQMATSSDGGTKWSAPFLLNRDGKQAEHGFVTLAARPSGGVGATWLDGRNMTAADHDHGGGDMTLRYATIQADGTIADDRELDGRTCECCATGMTMTTSGPVIVYRDRSAEEVRDIGRVAKTASGWTPPALVNADGWEINACPVNGPQIDAIGNRVATAWFTAAENKSRVYVAFSDDAGSTFGKPVRIDGGQPLGRVDILLLDAETAVVTWLEQTGTGAQVRARRVSHSGNAEQPVKIADSGTSRATGFTRIARVGREVYFAWTEQSGDAKRVRLAKATF